MLAVCYAVMNVVHDIYSVMRHYHFAVDSVDDVTNVVVDVVVTML